MAMTASEMIDFFRQQAELFSSGVELMANDHNAPMVAVNVAEVFKASLVQGLIAWRFGIGSPIEPLRRATATAARGQKLLQGMDPSQAGLVPIEQSLFLSYLLSEQALTIDSQGLASDRLLDVVLGRSLQGGWDDANWEIGLGQLRKNKRTKLSHESYLAYQHLIHANPNEVPALVAQSSALFGMRKKDAFYKGGPQSEGGGPDNDFTVDYRLAAIMKKIGFRGDSIHSWKWD
jgi:hypothetical protein